MSKARDWGDVGAEGGPGAFRRESDDPTTEIPFDDARNGAALKMDQKTAEAPVISSAKILQHEVFPPIKSVVKGYLVEGLTILAGRPKIGKSWLAYDWLVTIASGGFCFGLIHCIEGSVLYLALEDNKRRIKSRLSKLLGLAREWLANFEYATEWPRANEGGLQQSARG